MRLDEITGDSESVVYDKLRKIYFILNEYSKLTVRSPEVEELVQKQLAELHEDSENLLKWTLFSDRIYKIYQEILTFQ